LLLLLVSCATRQYIQEENSQDMLSAEASKSFNLPKPLLRYAEVLLWRKLHYRSYPKSSRGMGWVEEVAASRAGYGIPKFVEEWPSEQELTEWREVLEREYTKSHERFLRFISDRDRWRRVYLNAPSLIKSLKLLSPREVIALQSITHAYLQEFPEKWEHFFYPALQMCRIRYNFIYTDLLLTVIKMAPPDKVITQLLRLNMSALVWLLCPPHEAVNALAGTHLVDRDDWVKVAVDYLVPTHATPPPEQATPLYDVDLRAMFAGVKVNHRDGTPSHKPTILEKSLLEKFDKMCVVRFFPSGLYAGGIVDGSFNIHPEVRFSVWLAVRSALMRQRDQQRWRRWVNSAPQQLKKEFVKQVGWRK